MAKFVFKMESLLRIKSKLEEQAKAEYGVEAALLRQEEEKLQNLKNRLEQIQQQLKEAVSATLRLIEIKELEQGVESIKYAINVQKIAVLNQEKRVERAREKLDEAMKERKTFEKLKEKAFETFVHEINAQEQKEVDELVSFRFCDKEKRED